MNLQRGFLRITIVASVITGALLVFVHDKPAYEDFRWRRPTSEEIRKAEAWDASPKNEFDPDMFLMVGENPIVLKENQKIIPFQFALLYFALPFVAGSGAIWLLYALMRFVVFDYVVRGFLKEKA